MTGLMPSCWGQMIWGTIHSIAYVYNPKIDKENYFNFFWNLGNVLPCAECKAHYYQNITKLDLQLALESQETLFRFMYNFHNLVNKQTGVPESKWPSYEDVKKRYSGYEASCTEMPGVCGSVKKSPTQKGTMVVETFGSYTEDSIKSTVIISVLSLALLISLYYNYKKVGRR
jgi:hypothetical protein